MKKILNHLVFASLCLFASFSYANEAQCSKENVVVNSRPLSIEQLEHLLQNRQEEWDLSEQEEATRLGVLMIPIKTHHFAALASNQLTSTAGTFSPYHYHWIECFPQGNILKIEDGSEWFFDRNEAHVLRTWRPGDTIVITPKQQLLWGSNYAYTITNKDLNSSINANLFLGPYAFGSWTSWIAGISRAGSQVHIINGQGERTLWEISNTDKEFFEDWSHNDAIIVGQNDSYLWMLSSYDHILINVNMNHYVRAKLLSSSSFKQVNDGE